MTSIKPPASGPTAPTAPAIGGPQSLTDTPDAAPATSTAQKPEGPSGSFQSTLEQAQQAGQSQSAQSAHQVGSAAQVGASSGADAIAALAREVEIGRVTLDQAVDRLLDQTLAKVQKHLSSQQLDELSGLLRDALLHDPTLSALRGEHG